MHDNQMPSPDDLPSSEQLRFSTIIAAGVATLLLVLVILPADYGIDPTRVGRLLGLTEMGQIKARLAREAAEDAATSGGPFAAASLVGIEKRLAAIEAQLAWLGLPAGGTAAPPAANAAPEAAAPPAARAVPRPTTGAVPAPQQKPVGQRNDEVVFSLRPNQGIEVKMQMREGDRVNYAWKAEGGAVNYDAHGEPPNATRGSTRSYKSGRGVNGDEGVIQAAFGGTHGWFWRNRSSRDVTITLRTAGYYSSITRP